MCIRDRLHIDELSKSPVNRKASNKSLLIQYNKVQNKESII